jgi:exodeoxyribonuclease VII large subunit
MSFSRIGARLSGQLLRTNVERRRERYGAIAQRLRAGITANIAVHRSRLARERERVGAFAERAQRALHHLIAVRQARTERGGQLLAAFSYRGVLARGFALVRDTAGRPLRSAAAIAAGMPIEIEFADGRVGAHADGGAEPKPAEPAKPRGRRRGADQGDLF